MESIDILDSLCSRIRIDTRGNTILRILPVYSSRANRGWISDRARFFYESVMVQRAMNPLINLKRVQSMDRLVRDVKHPFYRCSWEMAFAFITSAVHVCAWNNKLLLTFSSPIGDLHTTLALFEASRSLGIAEPSVTVSSTARTDFRADYIIPVPDYSWSKEWMISHYFIYVGFNPRHESPVLNIRFRVFHMKQAREHRVFIVGEAYYMNIRGMHDGISDRSLRDLGRGLATYSLACAQEDPIFLVGPSLALSGGRYSYRSLLDFVLFSSLVHLIVHNVVPYSGDLSMFEWGCPVDIRLSAGIRINASGSDANKSAIGMFFIQDNDHLGALSCSKPLTMFPMHLVSCTGDGRYVEPVETVSELPIFAYPEWESTLFGYAKDGNGNSRSSNSGFLFFDHVVVVYNGANVGFAARSAHLVLPSMTYVEQIAYYVTCSGDVRFTTPAIVVSHNFPSGYLLFTMIRLFISEFFPFLSAAASASLCKFLRSPYVLYDKYYRITIVETEVELPVVLDISAEHFALYRRMRAAYGLDDEAKILACARVHQFDPVNPGMFQHDLDMLVLRTLSGPYSFCTSISYAEEYEFCYKLLLEEIIEYNKRKYKSVCVEEEDGDGDSDPLL